MALKTDYKDAVYTGNRKYTQTNNTDGTVSLVDATAYSTEGDPFGAADINATNQVVNANSDSISALQQTIKTTVKQITLSASNWQWSADHWWCYLNDPLITETSNQEIIPAVGITPDQLKALQKANIFPDSQESGHVGLRVFGAKPTIDIPITVIFRGEK